MINDIIEFYSLLEAYFATEKRDSHLFIFLTNATWNNATNTTYSGQARKIGGLCSTDRFNRTAICGYYKNDIRTAEVRNSFFKRPYKIAVEVH